MLLKLGVIKTSIQQLTIGFDVFGQSAVMLLTIATSNLYNLIFSCKQTPLQLISAIIYT